MKKRKLFGTNQKNNKICLNIAIIFAFIFAVNAPKTFAAQDQWESVTPSGASGTFTSIVSIGDYVYLGTTQGIYKSEDGGLNWSATNSGLTDTNINSIAIGWTYDMDNGIYAVDSNTPVFAATSAGVFKSTIGSSSWTESDTGITNTNISDIKFDQFKAVLGTDNSTVYASGAGGVYRSDDTGGAWTDVSNEIAGEGVKKIMTEFNGDFSSGNIFAITDGEEIYSSTLFSVDGATPESWSLLEDGDLSGTTLNEISFLYPTGGSEFLATENGILKSNNSGSSWSAKNDGLTGLGIKSVQSDYLEINLAYAAAGASGIFKSINEGESWADANLGISSDTITAVNTNPALSTIVYAISASSAYKLDLSDPYLIPAGADVTAPSQIDTLSFSDAKAYSFEINWIAPGDDADEGTATSYDLRYYTSEITEENWDLATQVSGEPAPGEAGSVQSMEISGLVPGTTYYFGIITTDDSSNTSSLSPSRSATVTYSGDLDGDHSVGVDDFDILLSNYDTTSVSADINEDGIVDIFDYSLLKQDYGESF